MGLKVAAVVVGLSILTAWVSSCKKKKENDMANQICTYLPTYIDTTINLNDNSFFSLRTKGYAFTKSGIREIIIVKVSDSEYKAFDRASSYKMAEIGCPLKVDPSAFFFKDTCSGSKFDFMGNVIQEPAVCPLLQYSTVFVSSDRLRIFHAQQ